MNRDKSHFRSISPFNPLDIKPFSPQDVLARASEWYFTVQHSSVDKGYIEKQIGWNPPPFGTVKLNSDGAMDKHGNAAARGLL